MSQPLDLNTVLLLHKLSFFAGALCFLYVRSQSRESVGLGFLALGFFLVAMASTLGSLGKFFISFDSTFSLAGNFAGLVGYSTFWVGMCRISSQRQRKREWLILCLPVAVSTTLFLTGYFTLMPARVMAFQAAAAALLLAAAYTIWSDHRIEPLPVRKVLGATVVFAAILSAMVAFGAVFPETTVVSARNAFFVSIICHFAIAFFVMALVKERAEAGLKRLADLDILTGVPNRRSFTSHLPDILRQGDVIVMIDIDYFKRINDGFGHLAGDEILARVARELSSRIRPTDHFARFGGEEFILYQPAIGKDEALALAESTRLLVSAVKHIIEDQRIPVTLSMGMAVCDEKTCAPQALIRKADMALYASKASGRDRLTVYSAEDFEVDHSASDLKHAG